MPKGKSDSKRFEKQEKRRIRNRAVRNTVKTFISRARQAITDDAKGDETQGAVIRAISALDSAARKGIIHRNNAARRKSRLMKRLNTQLGATTAA